MTRALVIGARGFVGSALAVELGENGFEVVGAGRAEAPMDWPYAWASLDVTDAHAARNVVADIAPRIVFQLAGSGGGLEALFAVNVIGTKNVLDAVAASSAGARIVVTGSAAEYGQSDASGSPFIETSPLNPISFYGIAKVAQTQLAVQASRIHNADVVVARTFNITGPGEPPSLVFGAFASQLMAIEAGRSEPVIHIGNLEAERDFVDVRDVARALRILAESGKGGEIYNVSTGRGTRIHDAIDTLAERARVDVALRFDAARGDRPDVAYSVGSASKLRDATGWEPVIPLSRSLDDLLEYWRRVHKEEIR